MKPNQLAPSIRHSDAAVRELHHPAKVAMNVSSPDPFVHPRHFPEHERKFLMRQPRIGPRVIEQLEAQGITSLELLRQVGVEQVVDDICRSQGTKGWFNRRTALTEALSQAGSCRPDWVL